MSDDEDETVVLAIATTILSRLVVHFCVIDLTVLIEKGVIVCRFYRLPEVSYKIRRLQVTTAYLRDLQAIQVHVEDTLN